MMSPQLFNLFMGGVLEVNGLEERGRMQAVGDEGTWEVSVVC